MKSLRRALETFACRVAFALLPRLSRRAVVVLAGGLARIAWLGSPALRRVAMANLDQAFGDTLTAAEKTAILRSAYRSFALVLIDTFWFARDTRQRLADWVDIGSDLDRLLAPGPYVCLTLHLGNWEVLGMALQAKGMPLASVANPLKNPAVDRLFVEHRERLGQKILPRAGAVRGMLKVLRDGEKIALVLDQNTGLHEGGAFVDFFGLPATTSLAPASLAIRTRSPILMTACVADKDGRYRTTPAVYLEPENYPAEGDRPELALTAELNRRMEAVIRAYPGYWCWMYKRWKHRLADMPAEKFPWYTSVVRVRAE